MQLVYYSCKYQGIKKNELNHYCQVKWDFFIYGYWTLNVENANEHVMSVDHFALVPRSSQRL